MAEAITRSEARKFCRPSGLRQELHPESIDNDLPPDESIVQAPDSQCVIPETQFDDIAAPACDDGSKPHDDGDGNDHGFSPRSKALFEKNSVTEENKTTTAAPVDVSFYDKSTLSQAAVVPGAGFVFGQPKRASVMHTPTAAIQHSQSSHDTGAATEKGTTPIEPSSTESCDRLKDTTQDSCALGPRVLDSGPMSLVGGQRSTPEVVSSKHCIEIPISSLNVASSSRPDSHVPETSSTLPTVRNKKKKQRRRAKEHRGAAWPPRSKVTPIDFPIKSATGEAPIKSSMDILRASPPAMEDSEQGAFHSPTNDFIGLEKDKDSEQSYSRPSQTHDISVLPSTIGPTPLDQDIQTNDEDILEEPSPSQQPHSSLLGSKAVPDNQVQHASHTQPTHLLGDTGVLAQEFTAALQDVHDTSQIPNEVPESNQHHASVIASKKARGQTDKSISGVAPQKRSENVLRTVFDLASSPRVSKPAKQPCHGVAMKPPSTVAMQRIPTKYLSRFDRALATLSAAYAEEQCDKVEHHATEVRYLREINEVLQHQNELHSNDVAHWKEKHGELLKRVDQFRERAKVNQKYVTGLQADYEKLQKASAACQTKCKEDLKAKLVEIESERHSLAQEFHNTLDVVAKGQKKSKQFADEMYMQLIKSESDRVHLTRSLAKESALRAEQKEVFESLQQQLSSSIWTTNSQISEHTTTLAGRLDRLSKSMEDAIHDKDIRNDVTETLTAVRALQQTPFLAVKDVSRAESMLRQLYDGVNKKLDTLSRSMKAKQPPLEDAQSFIKNQLVEIQQALNKHDEIIGQKHHFQQLNDGLQQQLKIEQQNTIQSSEEIKLLQSKVVDFEAEVSRLETERMRLLDPSCNEELRASREDARKVRLELQLAIKGKMDVEEKLQSAQSTIEELSCLSTETESLQARLQHQKETIEASETLRADLERRITHLETDCTKSETLYANTQAEHLQRISEKDAQLLKAEIEQVEEHKKNQTAMDDALKRLSGLEEDKKELQLTLGRAQNEQSSLDNKHALLIAEHDELRNQLTEVRKAKDSSDEKLLDAQRRRSEAFRNLAEQVEQLQGQLAASQAAVKDAEAKNRLQETEHRKKLHFDRQRFEELVRDSSRTTNRASEISQTFTAQTSTTPHTSSRSYIDTGSKKRVSRDNSSVLTMDARPGSQEHLAGRVNSESRGILETGIGNLDVHFGHNRFDDDLLEVHDTAIAEPTPEPVQDTQSQEILLIRGSGGLTDDGKRLPFEEGAQGNRESKDESSLSELCSDDIMEIGISADVVTEPTLAGRVLESKAPPRRRKLLTSDINHFISSGESSPVGPQSSQSTTRPRSQANTASRLMQPPSRQGQSNVMQQDQAQNYSPKRKAGIGAPGADSKKKHKASDSTTTAHHAPRSSSRDARSESEVFVSSPLQQKFSTPGSGKSSNAIVQVQGTTPSQVSPPSSQRRTYSKSATKTRGTYLSTRQTRSKTVQEDRFNQEIRGR